MQIRAVLVWLVIALAEVVQGWWRVRWLNRRVGDRRARQIGVGTGSLLILVLAWTTAPWVGADTPQAALAVGALWTVLMLALDVGFGRFVFRAPWARIWGEFDLRQGRLRGLGMAVLFAAPWIAGRLRGWF